ncbi:MAG: lactoylglutathione lyase, partial [Candidatus Saccharibacteria bacterium]|nr:lactoylglutathione lyase [Rhodoferax sp.]
LDRSVAFFKAVGFNNNPTFTDSTAACIAFTDDINVMLLTHGKFQSFTKKPIANAHNTTEVLTCLNFDDRAKVDELVEKAIAAGGSEPERKPQDDNFMYSRSFDDLDGHVWEIMWMNPKGTKKA